MTLKSHARQDIFVRWWISTLKHPHSFASCFHFLPCRYTFWKFSRTRGNSSCTMPPASSCTRSPQKRLGVLEYTKLARGIRQNSRPNMYKGRRKSNWPAVVHVCCYKLERVKIYQPPGIIRLNLRSWLFARCPGALYSCGELVIELKFTGRNDSARCEKSSCATTKQQMHASSYPCINEQKFEVRGIAMGLDSKSRANR